MGEKRKEAASNTGFEQIRIFDQDLEKKSLDYLIELSSLIDMGHIDAAMLSRKRNQASKLARTINVFLKDEDTIEKGEEAYKKINELIVQKNQEEKAAIIDGITDESKIQLQEKGTFKVILTHSGYMFEIVAENGETLASSEIYSKEESCQKGIECVINNANSIVKDQTEVDYQTKMNPKYVIFQTKDGQYRFQLKAKNGAVLVASNGYKDKISCDNAIKKMIRIVPTAGIENG